MVFIILGCIDHITECKKYWVRKCKDCVVWEHLKVWQQSLKTNLKLNLCGTRKNGKCIGCARILAFWGSHLSQWCSGKQQHSTLKRTLLLSWMPPLPPALPFSLMAGILSTLPSCYGFLISLFYPMGLKFTHRSWRVCPWFRPGQVAHCSCSLVWSCLRVTWREFLRLAEIHSQIFFHLYSLEQGLRMNIPNKILDDNAQACLGTTLVK